MRLTPAVLTALLLVLIATGGVIAAFPQPASQPAAITPPANDASPDGYWPDEAMVSGLLHRWTNAAAEAYSLSPRQREQLRTQLGERWSEFLLDHRAELQPLLREYLEVRVAGCVPPAEAARSWARRALPQFDALRQCVREGAEEFSDLLDEHQRAKFHADQARLESRFEGLHDRLWWWEQGSFTPQDWRQLTEPAGTKERSAESQPSPADELELEMSAWDRYVRLFVTRYGLDATQRLAAESILTELKDRARAHHHRHRLRIAALEELIRRPELLASTAQVEQKLAELYGPIDAMFAELQRRVERIPTRGQRRQAEDKNK